MQHPPLLIVGCLMAVLALAGPAASQQVEPEYVELSELAFIDVECSDGIDNDGDGQVDFPQDPDCVDAADEAERRPTPLGTRPPRITPLPWPPGAAGVRVAQVSGDGAVKTGYLLDVPPGQTWEIESGSVVWEGTRVRVIEDLRPDLAEGFGSRSHACGVSDDGRYVVGMHGLGENGEGGTGVYVWDRKAEAGNGWRGRARSARSAARPLPGHAREGQREEKLVDLEAPLAESGHADSFACAVSDTGIVVGRSHLQPVRWEDRQLVPLEPRLSHGELSGFASAHSITPDGSVIVGLSNRFAVLPDAPELGEVVVNQTATRWIGSDTRPVLLSPLDGMKFWSGSNSAYDVSDDGTTIVGIAMVLMPELPSWPVLGFRLRDGALELFGRPEAGMFPPDGTHLVAVSADGSLALGSAIGGAADVGPIVLAGDRLRSLVDLLENEYGADLEGWDLSSARWPALSSDGRTIAGNARRSDGVMAPFEVRLPPACSDGLDNDGDGDVDHPEDRDCRHASDTSERASGWRQDANRLRPSRHR